MDPLVMPIITGILKVLDVFMKAGSSVKDIKHAKADHARLSSEASQLYGLLLDLQYRVEATSVDDSCLNKFKLLAQENGPIQQMQNSLEEILKQLPGPGKGERFIAKVMWPWNKKDADEVLQRIERVKSIVHCAILGDLTAMVTVVHQNINDLTEQVKTLDLRTVDLKSRSIQDQQHKIAQWLKIPDPSTNYYSALQKRQPGTGLWLLEAEQFGQWLSDTTSLMWLHGIPGCGKTVLSAAALQHLLQLQDADHEIAVAYFYFDFNDNAKQRTDKMVRSILHQVASRTAAGRQAMEAVYERCDNGQRQPSSTTIWELLQDILSAASSAYIVLDALDECTDLEALMDHLTSLARKQISGLRILATSRREKEIEEAISSIPHVDVGIHSAIVDVDINTYIEVRLNQDPKMQKWSGRKDEISEHLMAKADGMFYWVHCQLETIRRCVMPPELQKALESLPTTLDETYDRILEQLDSQGYLLHALTVLQWLCYSVRPLSLPQIVEILAIDVADGAGFLPENRLPEPESIRTICSSLIDIYVADRNDQEHRPWTTMVRLSHNSVKEYLKSERCGYKASFAPRISHEIIAKASLHYLLYLADQGHTTKTQATVRYPLARRVAEQWWEHAHNVGRDLDQKIVNLVLRLMSDDNAGLKFCIRLHNPDIGVWALHQSAFRCCYAPLLYYAAMFGLSEVVSTILENGSEVTDEEGSLDTALLSATGGGHATVVQMLLDHGANVNAPARNGSTCPIAVDMDSFTAKYNVPTQQELMQGRQGWTALILASELGREAVVKVLLDRNDIDVDARREDGVTALHAASERKRKEVVRMLLNKGANVDIAGGPYKTTALHEACQNGCNEVVQMLIARGASADIERGRGHWEISDPFSRAGIAKSPLWAAVKYRSVEMVKSMLEGSAKIDFNGRSYRSALQEASGAYGDGVILQMLLDRDAQAELAEESLNEALYEAARWSQKKVAQMLLDRIAKIGVTRRAHRTALQGASSGGSMELVQVLLDKYGDTSFTDELTLATALVLASMNGCLEVVELLSNKVADINAVVGDCFLGERSAEDDEQPNPGTALQVASYNGRSAVVQILLDHGADIDRTGSPVGHPETALSLAVKARRKDVVTLLLDKGADASLISDSAAALRYASGTGRETMVRMLLDKGTDVHAFGEGGTALQGAAYRGHAKVVEILLDEGVDVNVVGNNRPRHETALQLASWGGHGAIVRMLLNKRADVNAADRTGQTALHDASNKGHVAIVRMLLENGANVNAADRTGRTALHDASNESHEAIVRMLVENGANVNAADRTGRTALHDASNKGHETIVQMLVENGANVNAVDMHGRSALHWASKGGHKSVMRVLREAGAVGLPARGMNVERTSESTDVQSTTSGDAAEHLLARSSKENALEGEQVGQELAQSFEENSTTD
ncbi:Ankyrin-3 [Cyphellophora attinorum]|uniref:Ankyrin-3 n=1 Tax=Cyphellophora attinorum TaxID=1664694 RepID=A0A0N0NLB4_9EURO|nr:Ankyrin-3 [Phialophora attinorum]KPI38988.1 Ankyrin-3 [Phialophora attinorum]